MANDYTTLRSLFGGIAEAIRSKTGSNDRITACDFPTAIGAIETDKTEIEDAIIGDKHVSYYFNDRVTLIRQFVFYEANIESVEFPEVVEVHTSAFAEDTYLTRAKFEKLTSIFASAFSGCYNLREFIAPCLYIIGPDAFVGCNNLSKIDILGSYMYNDGNAYARGLIDVDAFYNSNLSTLIIRTTADVVQLYDVNAFGITPLGGGSGYIYVPASMVDRYKAAENWSTFANQIRAIEDYPAICGTTSNS